MWSRHLSKQKWINSMWYFFFVTRAPSPVLTHATYFKQQQHRKLMPISSSKTKYRHQMSCNIITMSFLFNLYYYCHTHNKTSTNNHSNNYVMNRVGYFKHELMPLMQWEKSKKSSISWSQLYAGHLNGNIHSLNTCPASKTSI